MSSLDRPGFKIKDHKNPLMLKLIDQVLGLYEHLYLLLTSN